MHVVAIATPAGKFTAGLTSRGLARLEFPRKLGPGADARMTLDDDDSPKLAAWRELTAAALRDSLAGKRPRRLPPLDLRGGTPFQCRVWRALRGIAAGRTRSYGELAALVGTLRGARAVGAACGANPVPVLVPCHRVLAANGKLGGFSGGLDWKRRLLSAEGVAFRAM
jgi:O-6-methylguanine DNA methyltransferase